MTTTEAKKAALIDELHASSEIKEIPLNKLQVDSTYQRDTSETLVDKIANDWDVVASELILVSNRGTRDASGDVRGGLWIVNGQHRSKAAQKRGMEKIWARVIDLRKVEDPASVEATFRLKTNVRMGDRPLERFKAQLRAGDEQSIAIRDILASFGTEINTQTNLETGINAVVAVEQIYQMNDGALLREVLQLIKDAWKYPGGKHAQASLLKGIAWFIDKHASESERSRLVTKLSGLGPNPLASRAATIRLTMGGSLWINYYRAIVDLYNDQLKEKNRLEWKIRGSQSLGKGGPSA